MTLIKGIAHADKQSLPAPEDQQKLQNLQRRVGIEVLSSLSRLRLEQAYKAKGYRKPLPMQISPYKDVPEPTGPRLPMWFSLAQRNRTLTVC